MQAEFVLYGRPGCHLCDDMRAGLAALQPELGFRFTEVDVDSNPDLARRYGHLVPVLEHAGAQVCHYFLDEDRLRACFG